MCSSVLELHKLIQTDIRVGDHFFNMEKLTNLTAKYLSLKGILNLFVYNKQHPDSFAILGQLVINPCMVNGND